ncbi:MAG: hypothetical protein BJG00_019045 [Limnothrix sp. CACIAM 69d]|nr:MAG: hypothetical protein BJG00_019045 [Limnothrix sp. CACIAM 69d]
MSGIKRERLIFHALTALDKGLKPLAPPDPPTPLPPRSANGGIRIVGDLTAITQPLPRFTQGGIRVAIDWPIAPEWADS